MSVNAQNVVDTFRSQYLKLRPDQQAAARKICDANGISLEELIEDGNENITGLEMFLSNFPNIVCLNLFPYLRKLNLTYQDIRVIENLDGCPLIEEMWLCNNAIERIQNISNLHCLRKLFLHSNRITAIENLHGLGRLEVLWLAENRIRTIEGLDDLSSLVELNLSRNEIAEVGDRLPALPALRTFNVSDNRIGSFKEICYLIRLAELRDLRFNDPHYGSNPLANLYNYQTYILFMLPHLEVLDTVVLSPETKQMARVTYLKKKMYYNMKAKTLRRNATTIMRLATRGRDALVTRASRASVGVFKAYKDALSMLDEDEHGIKPLEREERVQLRSKASALEACLEKKWGSVHRRRRAFDEAVRQMIYKSDVLVRRVLLELESGGNIRLEEGRKEDLWFTSCADLLTSRFHSYDYGALGVTGINVLRVTRIHNRCLRNVFDQKCGVSSSNAKAGSAAFESKSRGVSIEHLFYGMRPNVAGHFQRIVEEGFRKGAGNDDGAVDEAVVLSNSVNLTDMERLVHEHPSLPSRRRGAPNDASDGAKASSSSSSPTATGSAAQLASEDENDGWRTGQLIVAKVNLGTYVPDAGVTVPGGITSLTSLPPLRQARFPKFDSVYRTKVTDTKQRLWYIFEAGCVLPEYIVEFRYHVKGRCPVPLEQKVLSCEPALADMGAEMMAVAAPVMNFILAVHDTSAASSPVSIQQMREREPLAINHVNRVDEVEVMEDEFAAAMLKPPLLATRPRLNEGITEDVLMQCAPLTLRGSGISACFVSITHLNLHACGIRKIEGLHALSNLTVLILSFNEITKMEGLSELSNIETIDVGHNAIRRIEGLRGLARLTRLDLQHNNINRLEDLNVLKKSVQQLQVLDLRENDVQDSKSYRGLVLRRLFALQELDGIAVTKEEVAEAMDSSSTLTLQLIAENAYTKKRTAWNLSMDLRASSVSASNKNSWTAMVEEVSLENQNIRRIQNLESFSGIRVANFRDNEISRMEGLDSCIHIEELCLEGNRISTIEGLDNVQQLRKLELGRNRISSLSRLEHLKHLVQLSVEDNDISSLSGLAQLTSLMELYIGNNNISELREVQQLRELPKLIILDLLGNPVYREEDSRHYIVYNLRKLKVLDGLSIEATEQAQAKAKFAGKLTLELLEDKIGEQYYYERTTELDLSGLKIRDLGGIFLGQEFARIRELNLENNYLTSIVELGELKHLQVLRLNNNRLENFSFADEHTSSSQSKSASTSSSAAASTTTVTEQRPAVGDDKHTSSSSTSNRFPALEIMQLGGNQIRSIATLRLDVLKSLRSLFLQDNEIHRLEGLANLTSLQELVLDRNRVKHLESNYFAGIDKLVELRIEDNGLRSISTSGPLRKLRSLHMGGNRVQDMGEIEKLSSYTSLIELTIAGNPVSRRPAYRALVLRKLPALMCLDGANVSAEEREQVEAMFAQNEKEFPNERNIIPMKVPLKLTSHVFDALSVHGGSFDGILGEPIAAGNSFSIAAGPTASGIGGRGVGVGPTSFDEQQKSARFVSRSEKMHEIQQPRRTSVIDHTGANFGPPAVTTRRHSTLGVIPSILSKQSSAFK